MGENESVFAVPPALVGDGTTRGGAAAPLVMMAGAGAGAGAAVGEVGIAETEAEGLRVVAMIVPDGGGNALCADGASILGSRWCFDDGGARVLD